MSARAIILVLFVFACGCAQTKLAPDAVRLAPGSEIAGEASIEGLKARFARIGEDGAPMRVLVVNGMATNAHGYSFDTQKRIAAALGQGDCRADRVLTLHPPVFVVGAGAERYEFPPASLRITAWAAGEGAPKVIFYETLWTPYADAFTDRYVAPSVSNLYYRAVRDWEYCAGDDDIETAPKARDPEREEARQALVNRVLIEDLMVGGFTDAVIAVGPLGVAARDAIRQSLCIMVADALAAPSRTSSNPRCSLTAETLARFDGAAGVAAHLSGQEFAIVTYSLGSFLLLDTLDEFRLWPGDLGPPETTCALMPAVLDETPVYMFSNQVALLLAAHPHFGCDPNGACTVFSEFGSDRTRLVDPRAHGDAPDADAACKETARLRLIAFNDPNDVMGYRLPDILLESPLIGDVINVRVRNPAFGVPGLFVSPASVHSNHGENKAIIDFILDGWPLAPGF
ncbi:MAG: hypothetical protein AAFW81_00905 [Pseudomonadota bacterium]